MPNLPNILVLDDDALIGEALAEGISDRGGTCRSMTDPGQVTDADWDWADIAVVDLQLGGGHDGPQFLRRRQGHARPPRLVLVSGFDPMVLDASARAARDLGYDVLASISKPIPIARLARLLEAAPVATAMATAPRPAPRAPDPAMLADAIERGEIDVVYQPQHCLRTGRLSGVEALARWTSPTFGTIAPDLFVGTAEKHALIGRLTEAVAAVVADDLALWSLRGFEPKVSVNLSGASLGEPMLVERLRQSLGHWRERVTFELTETAAAQLRGAALESLVRLRLAGFGLSLDDFGAGQNRFDRLIEAPITELKLDRRFAERVAGQAGARIVHGLAAFAHALGARCVAEGIETAEQRRRFGEAGCDAGQGWGLARPMDALTLARKY